MRQREGGLAQLPALQLACAASKLSRLGRVSAAGPFAFQARLELEHFDYLEVERELYLNAKHLERFDHMICFVQHTLTSSSAAALRSPI